MAPPAEPKNELNMTPMIDVVFLLLIFFMVVSEMARAQEANVQLPFGPAGKEKEENPDKSMLLIVNVQLQTDGIGHILIGGRKYDFKKLNMEVQKWAQNAGMEDPEKGISNLRVQIRADRNARMKAVQLVLDACMKNKVYKTVVKTNKRSYADIPPELLPAKAEE